jgi:hypothetical protein
LKLISLKAENVKRLKVLDLTPNEHINRISGANGSGKSSALDAIEWLLTGTSTVPSQPVRRGAGKAVIWGDLGEIIVTRRFTEGGSRNGVLSVEPKDGKSRYQQAQTFLDGLLNGKMSFDPLAFLRMHPKKQVEEVKNLVKVDVDLTAKVEDDPDYIRRREAKKEKTAVETRRDAVYVAPDLPKDKVDDAALIKQLREASEYNANVGSQHRERTEFVRNMDSLSADIDEHMAEVAELRRKADELQAEADGWAKQLEKNRKQQDKWEPLPELRDATKLAEEIDAARKINQAIDRRTLRETYEAEAEQLEREIESLSTALDERAAAKADALAKVEFPVPGLAFGDDELIYRGYPFNQVSNADQIRCAVAIGMASTPELRVMRIKDGSLLDNESMQILAEMARAHDFQVWIEQVDETGKVGIYLEDGEVAAVNEEPLNQPKAAKPVAKKRTKKEATHA